MRRKDELIPLEHPGIFLEDEFLKPLNISAYRLAKDIGMTPMRISEILRSKRGISANTGLRLAKYFGMSEGYFIRLQAQHDMDKAKESLVEEIEGIKTISSAG
jgi:addiction module HigA family antidote